MTTNDDNIKWVVGRLQALQLEYEEARRADRVVDHAACRIASETCLQELLRAYDRLDEAQAEIEGLHVELQRAYDAKSQQAVYAGEHADRAEAYRVACLQAEAEVERLRAEIQPRIERSIAFQDAMEEAEAERDEARAEVERLKAQRDAAYRTGQEAMRKRCAVLCDDWEAINYCDDWMAMELGAQQCAEAIRALEVEL
jgi:DNA repair exonuclease SbcCD ATPase subunit